MMLGPDMAYRVPSTAVVVSPANGSMFLRPALQGIRRQQKIPNFHLDSEEYLPIG
jgi:hypothetical protein